jgi:serine/threonine-protein kinase
MAFTTPTEEQIQAQFPQVEAVEFIQKGGFKAVYRARVAGKPEAFKLVHIPNLQGEEYAEEFREECLKRITREVQVLGRCQTPFLVKLGSLPPTEARLGDQEFVAYTEEFLSGDDLKKLIDQRSKPDEKEVRALAVCLLKAIRELWGMGIIHRDIKPGNVVKLTDPQRPFVLLDLGIAYSIVDTPLTFGAEHRPPPGTFRYLAPEMLQPNFRVSLDFRSDIYTTGLTVFEYAAGQHPLAEGRDDLVTTLSRILRERPKPLAQFRPEFSPMVLRTVDQMLKKWPPLRPANLDELIARLEVRP